MRPLYLVPILLCVLLPSAITSASVLIANESWNYGDGTAVDVVGLKDGTGFETTTGWSNSSAGLAAMQVVDPTGTTYGALSYASADGSVVVNGGDRALRFSNGPSNTADYFSTRGLTTTLVPGTSPTVFVSFLMRVDAGNDQFDKLGTAFNGAATKGTVLYTGTNYGVAGMNAISVDASDPNRSIPFAVTYGATYFVVAEFWQDPTKASYGTNNWNACSFWVNPKFSDSSTPGGITHTAYASPTDGHQLTSISSVNMQISRLDAGDVFWVDEYKLGDTWDAVVTPEPASLMLLVGGGMALLRRRR